MTRKILFRIVIWLIPIAGVFGQQQQIMIPDGYNNLPINEFFDKAEEEFGVHFYYAPDSIPELTIAHSTFPAPLEEVLSANLAPYNIRISIDAKGNVFLTKDFEIRTALPADFFKVRQSVAATDTSGQGRADQENFLKTQSEYFSKTHIVGTKKAGMRVSEATVSGYVRSFTDSLPLVGATIYAENLETGTATNSDGMYTLTLPKGLHTLIVRNVGYEKAGLKVRVLSSGSLDLYLFKKVFLMEAVEIRSEFNHNVKSTQMGVEKISLQEMKEIPVVLGERDVIKVALLLQGVQTIGEGSSGFNVRGSPADQNLFYMADIPVYNTSHLFGFFSAFNPDVINEFTLYKSSIPANYGGRLSSIFEITPRQGNHQKFSARGGISPITARLLAEGPVIKDKLTYMAGFRSTYSDWVLDFVTVPEIKNSSGNFGDAIVNLTYKLNDNNQLKLLTYYSYDKISLASKVDNRYQNAGMSLSWFHTYSENHSYDLSLAYSRYSFEEDNYDYAISAYSLNYQLEHYQANLDFSYKPSENHTLRYGLSSVLYRLDNGEHLPYNQESLVMPVNLGKEK
ncbi:MAG: TonB-dependent receptor [Bacteroidales bacterium]